MHVTRARRSVGVIIIVSAQAVGLVLLDGALIQGAAAVANYAYVPAALVSILAYLLEYGAPKSDEPHDS